MEEGVHFAPLISLVITGLLQFDFTRPPGRVFEREHRLVTVGPDYLVDPLDQGLIELIAGIQFSFELDGRVAIIGFAG
jgi:hypothetical protein